jgi:hypothetical protein
MNRTRDHSTDAAGHPHASPTRFLRLPSPALVLAAVALFVALAGGATAAGIVTYAKHAGSADVAGNARHLDGKTATQIAASVRGPRGLQGPAGPAGVAGTAGTAGAAGATGSAGPKGDAGAAGPGGPQGPAGPQGPKGDKGDVGAGLQIVGTVASESALPSAGATGDAYLVGGDLFVWTGAAWTDAGPVLGPKGDRGDTGATGPQGQQGTQGIQGIPGTAAVSIHTTPFSVAADDGTTVTGSCGAGQQAVSAGFDSNGDVFSEDTQPTAADDGWQILLLNADPDNPASGTVYVVCLG